MIHGEGRTGPLVHQVSYENVWNVKSMTEKKIDALSNFHLKKVVIHFRFTENSLINYEKDGTGLVALYSKLLSMISYHESS